MPQPARFHVVVRFAGRIVDDRCCAGALSLGDGGDVVMPGLGDVLELVRGDRLLPVDGLAGAVTTADALQPFESLEPAGMSLGAGDRAELRSIAHPELTVEIERISDERVRMRDRVALLPARETLFAAVLAGCLATVLGGKVVIAALTEPEVEVDDDKTELELAMYEYAPVIPAWAYAAPVIYAQPEPIEAPAQAVAASADPLVPRALVDVPGEPVPPLAMPDREAGPRKPKARRRRDRVETISELSFVESISDTGTLMALGSADGGVRLGTLDDSNVDVLSSIHEVPTEALGEGLGSVGVEGGVVGRALPDAEELPRKVLPLPERPVQPTIAVGTADEPTELEGVGPKAVIAAASPVDPRGGKFTLADALAGDDTLAKGTGTLTAIIATNHGKITCELFEDRAPNTVANFVGLARGTRESLDHDRVRWTKHRLYDGVTFHRVIDGFMIQGGDPSGTSAGGPGYEIADEIDPSLHHDRAGVLSMANKGPNTAGSQFFVTVAAAAHLDGKHAVFGHCDPAVPSAIAKLPVDAQDNHRPRAAVVIETVKIVRRVEAIRDPLPATGTATEAPAGPAPSDTPPPVE